MREDREGGRSCLALKVTRPGLRRGTTIAGGFRPITLIQRTSVFSPYGTPYLAVSSRRTLHADRLHTRDVLQCFSLSQTQRGGRNFTARILRSQRASGGDRWFSSISFSWSRTLWEKVEMFRGLVIPQEPKTPEPDGGR